MIHTRSMVVGALGGIMVFGFGNLAAGAPRDTVQSPILITSNTDVTITSDVFLPAEPDLLKVSATIEVHGPNLIKVSHEADRLRTEVSGQFSSDSGGNSLVFGPRSIRVLGTASRDGAAHREWSVTLPLVLTGKPSDEILDWIGGGHPGINVDSIGAARSPEAESALHRRALSLALPELTQRAEIIKAAIGAKSYSIVNINLAESFNNDGGDPSGKAPSAPMTVAALKATGVVRYDTSN